MRYVRLHGDQRLDHQLLYFPPEHVHVEAVAAERVEQLGEQPLRGAVLTTHNEVGMRLVDRIVRQMPVAPVSRRRRRRHLGRRLGRAHACAARARAIRRCGCRGTRGGAA